MCFFIVFNFQHFRNIESFYLEEVFIQKFLQIMVIYVNICDMKMKMRDF